MKNKIYLSSPHMGGSERNYVTNAFDTNWIAPLGPNVTGFEKDIETYLGNKSNVAALSSGTAAIHLALILLDVSKGDEVICQSMTFSASANPIVYQGATPIFVDSEPETWNICPLHLEEAIKDRIKNGKKPKAIIAVHLYGMPYKVDEVIAISKKYEIPIIEDSAEALGSTYKSQNCGTFGDIGVLSFNGNKIITTSGGGALVTKNPDVKQKAIFLATQARDTAPHYQHSEIGYNYRLSNICAGIGRGQMEVLDNHISLRRQMNAFYQEIFHDIEGVSVFTEKSKDLFSNHWLTCILINQQKIGFSPSDLRIHLASLQIESRPLWKPMHLQPVYKEAPYYGKNISEKLFATGLCLPSGSNLTNEGKNRIKIGIQDFLNKYL
ncbi:DegT/DnrJ/EryC1/StrS family aminotransferase [Patiriisocius hiemis]|uniref:Aminotransferase class I/II-fold pyridoxal phosphate-dependent enzyme n=1 Tax=Patiriisocius hiemis TaxID=3075604 RepID=A0ABU2YHU9_9FLAO|nr:aminotransferase class I/II-fold pyridoxal phosphate-dependent enzyme [Constantimarinum sp. W242]MDT0556648.1 aminotransferase class I/II-fold pyridoxal phosphate-dependent enzyme [Constantimarinum sp. W242]